MQIETIILSANMTRHVYGLSLILSNVCACNPLQQPPTISKPNVTPLDTQSTRQHFCRFAAALAVKCVRAVVNSIALNSNGQVC